MTGAGLQMRPIEDADADVVGRFLHENLNSRVPASAWEAVITPPWPNAGPNHGFLLAEADGVVVGVYVAIYSDRKAADGSRPLCNLGAFCVLEAHRGSSLRLIRAVLSQKGFDFTDLSPSGNVVALNERLGFRHLDTATRLVVNLPRPPKRGIAVSADQAVLRRVLRGRDAVVHSDHVAAAAARHVLAQSGQEYAYLVFRRDRRKGLPLFATPLYVGGDPDVLKAAWPLFASHLLVQHGLPFTLAEPRLLGFAPGPGLRLEHPRSKMVRGDGPDLEAIDYLYSELALIEW